MPLILLNWNVEWAASKWKAAELERRIGQQTADIICRTETDTRRLTPPEQGHSIGAQDDWGWLQIDQKYRVANIGPNDLPWARYHPQPLLEVPRRHKHRLRCVNEARIGR